MEKRKSLWQNFAHKNDLSANQIEQFKTYYDLLIASNTLFNITTITDLTCVLNYHFEDSFKLGSFIDMNIIKSIADVGSGGGFPGIPLKIKYPHITATLIEVSLKKRTFLEQVITALSLEKVDTCGDDWRTFLRKHIPYHSDSIDLFCARASLQPRELMRIFAGSSRYKTSRVCYWAARDWTPEAYEASYLKSCSSYKVGERRRSYCIFSC